MKLLRILGDYVPELDDVSDLVEDLKYLETYPGHNDLDTFIIQLFYLFGYGIERKEFEYKQLENYPLNMRTFLSKQAMELNYFGLYSNIVKNLFRMFQVNILDAFRNNDKYDILKNYYEWKRIKTRIEIILNMDEKLKDSLIDHKLSYVLENYGDDGAVYFWNYVTWHFLMNEDFDESRVIDMFASHSDKVKDYLSKVILSFKKFDGLKIHRGNINTGFEKCWGYQSTMEDDDNI